MSRGQLARTLINFPWMKYRAERRDQRAAFGQPRGRRTRPMCSRTMPAELTAELTDLVTKARPDLAGLEITDRGRAIVESGLSVRHLHEIETGCSPDQLCADCEEIARG